MVASPVTGETYDNTWVSNNLIAYGSGDNRGIAKYSNGSASNNWTYFQKDGAAVTFDSGKGYSMKKINKEGDV